ncbi:MAG: Na+/H+ antiporter NhaC family protein [Myxococcota bacterium]
MDDPSVLSLLPIAVAIGLALWTRQVVLSLFSGVLVAALIVTGGAPGAALIRCADPWLLDAISDRDHTKVALFSLLVAATVAIATKSGGTAALVELITRRARNRRTGMLATWVSGMVVFFDDYANCLIVGSAMRPVADRLRISREKLAYLVDSTAAPMATIALVSTWVGYEVGLMDDALRTLGRDEDAYAFFIAGLPYRFYPLLALAFGFWIAMTGRDFGPMLAAESSRLSADPEPVPPSPPLWRAWLAILPIAALVIVTGASLWTQGTASSAPGAAMFEIIGAADGYDAMLHGSLASVALAVVLAAGSRAMKLSEVSPALIDGMKELFEALVILYLAWSLGAAIGELKAADYLLSALGDALPAWSLPTVTFLLAAAIAFATGTSFGTMAVLMPLALPLALALEPTTGPIALGTAASVLSGAVWGDHCSPISDTTVLSSTGAGCDHTEHVRTQLPYAIAAGVVAVLFGTLPAGFGVSPWLLLPIGVAACGALVMTLGRVPTSQQVPSARSHSATSSHPGAP